MGKYSEWATKRMTQIERMNAAGVEAMQGLTAEPPVSAGEFTYDEWKENTIYERYQLFTYNGNAGFAKQRHTSIGIYPPFSAGTESLYGARPAPDLNGIYPYVYNMRADIGMKVRSEKDGTVYLCYANATDTLLYDPADVPAIFSQVQIN